MQYRIAQNFDGGNFDGYLLLKYLTESILMDAWSVFHHTPVMLYF